MAGTYNNGVLCICSGTAAPSPGSRPNPAALPTPWAPPLLHSFLRPSLPPSLFLRRSPHGLPSDDAPPHLHNHDLTKFHLPSRRNSRAGHQCLFGWWLGEGRVR